LLEPVLIDTSALIEALRPSGSREAREAIHGLLETGLALTTPAVSAEVLLGARRHEADGLQRLLELALTCLPTTWEHGRLAGTVGRELRSRGVTVPLTHLLIAATAISEGVPLLHGDAHFDLIAAHSALRSISILSG
jgi:predicted nucleic acid-binding protein